MTGIPTPALRLLPGADVFDVHQADGEGVTSHALGHLVAVGEVRRLSRGWYASGPAGSAWQEHRLRAVAMGRHFAGRAVVSHYSAVVLAGLPTFGVDLDTVHVTRTGDRNTRRRAGVALHAPPRLADVDGDALLRLPGEASSGGTVPLAWAIVQAGLVGDPRGALVAADAAVHAGLSTPAELVEVGRLFRRYPGIAAVRGVLRHIDGRAESPGETLVRHTLTTLGFRATPQVIIPGGPRPWRVDLLLDDWPVIVEFDGLSKYSDAETLAAEKIREDGLRDLGYEVVRFIWRDLRDRQAMAARITAAIARCRARGYRQGSAHPA